MLKGGEDLEDRLRTLWDILNNTMAMPKIDLPEDFACFMRLYIVTLQRPGEIARMDAAQLDFERRHWTVRRGRKGNPTHIIPLSPYALSLIQRATAIRDNADGSAIFPGCRNARGLASIDAISRRFHRLSVSLSWTDFSLMDIRRSCQCLLFSLSAEHQGRMIDLVLGRQPLVRRAQFHWVPGMVEKRKTFRAWETLLAEITGDDRLNEKRPALALSGDDRELTQPGGLSRPV